MTSRNNARIVGYVVDPDLRNATEVVGSAEINGEYAQHLLMICAQPEHPIDLGRNEDGDLVWVSFHNGETHTLPVLSSSPALALSFDPPQEEYAEDELLSNQRKYLHTVMGSLTQRRLLVGASALAGVILVLVGLGITAPPPHSTTVSPEQQVVTTDSSVVVDPDLKIEPTEAAIDFVLEGKVPGIAIPDGISREALKATVVSTSGEIVLVDVQADQPEGLTTFATLLLQKSGTAWRIREVFDPR